MPWILLIVGGVFEVGFTTCLRYVEGFRNIPWTLGFLACATISVLLLEMAVRSIPMGTSYVVWGGIGAIGTTIVGIIWFGEPVGAVRLGLIVAIVACVAGLKALA
jgi:Membrane transporters of cations and cationic drugs